MPRVTFYFDLGSPYAYLSAERLHAVLPEPVRWQPVLLGGLFRATGRSSWSIGDDRRREAGIAEIERRGRDYGLAPMRWPDRWPGDYLAAMLACTYAFAAGRGREFTMQAFRNAFRRGGDLGGLELLLRTGEQAGLARGELERAIGSSEVKRSLRGATEAAAALGVIGVPTVAIDDRPFWGDDQLAAAAAHLQRISAA